MKRTKDKSKAEMMRGIPHLTAWKKGHCTVLYTREDGAKVLRYHETDIVVSRNDGTFILDSGGYKTKMTKERINGYIPDQFSLYQGGSLWYLSAPKGKEYVFSDGMIIGPGNRVKTNRKDVARVKRVLKLLGVYCKKIAELKELPQPSAGDCFLCLYTLEGEVLGDGHRMYDSHHLMLHLKEGYIHGTLLCNAIRAAGRNPQYLFCTPRKDVVRSVRRYFKSQLGVAQ